MSEELTSGLLTHARRREFKKGDRLYSRASGPDALFWLESGLIRLSVTSESGREAVLGLVTPGQWFGEASLFAREPRGNDADAVLESTIAIVPAAAVHKRERVVVPLELRRDLLFEKPKELKLFFGQVTDADFRPARHSRCSPKA